MNLIKAEMARTEYVKNEHLMIFIDGEPLDKWLSVRLNNNDYLNLIPTWLGWLVNSKEQEYVWTKTRQCENETTILPILVCPDDLDFSCTVVVCEVKYTDTSVLWIRMGIDTTGFPDYIGKEYEWFQGVPLLEFPQQQYEACISEFTRNQDL